MVLSNLAGLIIAIPVIIAIIVITIIIGLICSIFSMARSLREISETLNEIADDTKTQKNLLAGIIKQQTTNEKKLRTSSKYDEREWDI